MISRKGTQGKKQGLVSTISNRAATVKYGAETKLVDTELYSGPERKHNKKMMRIINRMSKTANTAGSMGGSANVMESMPSFYHPEYEPSTLLMPRDIKEKNAWCRYFYKYDPIVSTAIDAHAELPISTIRLGFPKGKDKAKNRFITDEYEEMCSTEYLDLFNKLLQVGVEYYKLGNVFPFAQWSTKKNRWVKLTLLDPNDIEIDKLQFSDLMRVDLDPNQNIKTIIMNGPQHPKTGQLYRAIPEDVVELVKTGKKIPLNTKPDLGSHVAHISSKMADYELWGTSLIERNFKTLVYKDRLRQSQDAIAVRHLTPKHLIWAEDTGAADVDIIREQVDNAFSDPDYAIITNFELHWDLIGTSQGLMTLDSEWSWINEELLIGLMINRSFLLGEGSYANGQTALEVMNQRYSIYRERLESYIIHNLFVPMAKRNDWGEYKEGTVKKGKEVKWLYPSIKWNRLNLVDDTAHKQMMSQMVTQGIIDVRTFLESFGLDADTIKARLEEYEGTPLDANHFSFMQSVEQEVGRTLAPAIAKARANEMGLKLPEEGDEGGGGGETFSKKMPDKILKLSADEDYDDDEKTAETRKERQIERDMQRIKKKKERTVKELEVPLEKNKKPPRTDMKKPKLFSSLDSATSSIISFDKSQDMLEELDSINKSREDWVAKLMEKELDQNVIRVAQKLEDSVLTIGDSKERVGQIMKYLPQLFASKFGKNGTSLFDKVEMAKEKFSDEITKVAYTLDTQLSDTIKPEEKAEIVRNTVNSIL